MSPAALAGHLTWGYADPPAQAAVIANDWAVEARRTTTRVLEARRAAADSRLGPLTRSRLRAVADAMEHNLNALGALLAPVLTMAPPIEPALVPNDDASPDDSARAEPRARRGYDAALAYLFRDWIWGDEEVQATLGPVAAAMRSRAASGNVLVLGGGAMRLPWEIACAFGDARVTVVERNPVFGMAMARLQSGEAIDLWEIPVEPRDHASAAVRHSLRVPPNTSPGAPLTIVLGDAREWAPIEPLDWLVTPFVLDVAGDDALALIDRWTAWLRPGGRWINVGPLSFRRPWRAGSYTIEEVLEALPVRGLAVEQRETFEAAHLSSPHDARMHGFRGNIIVARKDEGR